MEVLIYIILNILTVILSINSNKAIDKTVENLDVSLSIVENNIEQIEKLNKLTKVKELMALMILNNLNNLKKNLKKNIN